MTDSPLRRSPRKSGFTLVELLVVIGIISVLLSILMPAMHMAWDAARTVQCASNLRQIGLGISMYVNDNKGYLPEGSDQLTPQTANTPTFDGLPSLLVYEGYLDAPLGTVSEQVPSTSVFRCPEGLDQASAGTWTGNRATDSVNFLLQSNVEWHVKKGGKTYYLQSWYGIDAITNNANTAYPFDTLISPLVYWPKKLSVIPRPTDEIGLYDSWGTFHNNNNGRVAARHRAHTATNCLFLDCHVETLNTLTGVPTIYNYQTSGPTMAMW
jgi:prepilin-type N-terminal cleavage/methylation domain-containing protein/prepilin-type processing-associated H-X9-DG protein